MGTVSPADVQGRFAGLRQRLWKPIVIIVVLLVIFFVLNPFVIIGPGERGVVLNWGAVSDTILGEGLNFRLPIVQTVKIVDVKIAKIQAGCDSVSKDLQDTKSSIVLNFHPRVDKVNKLYQEIGPQFRERVIDPAIQEIVKATTARYTAVELIQKREEVRNIMKAMLSDRLKERHLVVDDLAIVNFNFSEEFTRAIESKQTAEQLALKALRDLDRVKIEADQRIAQAKAEAEALRLQKQNISAELIELRQIEASVLAINKWDGKLPTYVGGGPIPFINLGAAGRQK
jgi:regulator of protease activity HflC (stomatin/prohibitin superfamily)